MLDVGDERQTAEAWTASSPNSARSTSLSTMRDRRDTSHRRTIGRRLDRIVRTNLRGPFLLSKLVFSVMKRQGQGQIVNITSTAAKRTVAQCFRLSRNQVGIARLSHALHAEGRPHNIKVTAMVCGGMRTPFLLDRFPDIDVRNLQDPSNVAQAVRFVLINPRRR